MRTSQVALISAIGFALLLVVALAVVLRVTVTSFAEEPPTGLVLSQAGRDDMTTTTLDLEGFTEVTINSGWHVELVRSDSWGVEISHPEGLNVDTAVRLEDRRLVIGEQNAGPRGWNWGRSHSPSTARIALPDLDTVEVNGATNMTIDGFRGDRLSITVSGTGNIEGRDSEYQQLLLTLEGAGNVDFRALSSVDARIDLSGASNVRLAMSGGELTGELSGFGNVTYYGEVSDESVDVSGFGRVTRANSDFL